MWLASKLSDMVLGSEATEDQKESKDPEQKKDDSKQLTDNINKVAEAMGSLFLMDSNGKLDKKADGITACLVKTDDYEYTLNLLNDEQKLVMSQPVASSMQMTFEKSGHAIIWLSYYQAIHSWRIQFDNEDDEKNFKLKLTMCLYEANAKEQFAKAIGNDVEWAARAYDDSDDDYESEDEETDQDRFGFDEYDDTSVKSNTMLGIEDDFNKILNVGMSTDRTLVTRGKKVGVFGLKDDELEFKTNFDLMFEGEVVVPDRSMLHQQDSEMLLINPANEQAVSCVDIERGQIVSEYGLGDDGWNIQNLGHSTKYGSRSGEATFIGNGRNAFYTIDPRVNLKNKMVQKTSRTGLHFNCIASTGEGQVALGTEQGAISMYSGVDGKRAKTLLPGLGDAIVGIDVTNKGDFILATTSQYLLVIPTKCKDDEKGRTGFTKAMGKQNKPIPIKLQLRHADLIKNNIQTLNFTEAHFNSGDGEEQWIVTSTGPYLITWNFRKVKQGKTDSYQIKMTAGPVVAGDFRYNNSDVVTLGANDVYVQTRSVKK